MIDERRFIDMVCELDGIMSVRLEGDLLTPLSGLEELLDIHGQPFDPPNAYLDFAMCRLASQHGTDILLDGLEGDVTVSHGVHYLDELAAQSEWAGFLREAKALDERLGRRPGTVFRQYGMEHLAEAGLRRLASGVLQLTFSGVPRLAARVLKARLRKRSANVNGGGAGGRIISEALAESVDWSSRGREPDRPRYPSEREAHIDFLRKAYIPSLMEFTHTNTRHFGVEIRHPMFDRRLVDFAVGLPPRMKLREGWTRYILREAMGGIVPDTVRWRPGKATLAPNFDLRMAREARHDVESVLDDAGRELRDYVKYDVLREEFANDRFRGLWPPVVFALFLKKSSANPQIARIES